MIRKTKTNPAFLTFLALLLFLLLLIACADSDPPEDEKVSSPEPSPNELTTPQTVPTAISTAVPPSPTLPPPTPTPLPVALVNGQPILIEDFEKELQRYESAQAELEIEPDIAGKDKQTRVLDALIERELIRQAADVQGITYFRGSG